MRYFARYFLPWLASSSLKAQAGEMENPFGGKLFVVTPPIIMTFLDAMATLTDCERVMKDFQKKGILPPIKYLVQKFGPVVKANTMEQYFNTYKILLKQLENKQLSWLPVIKDLANAYIASILMALEDINADLLSLEKQNTTLESKLDILKKQKIEIAPLTSGYFETGVTGSTGSW